jgi:DNA-directed RNA polymerase specialized sigma24 family protein
VLTQSDKEDLWKRGYYETIIEHDMKIIHLAVSRIYKQSDQDYHDVFNTCVMRVLINIHKWNPDGNLNLLSYIRIGATQAAMNYRSKQAIVSRHDSEWAEHAPTINDRWKYRRGSEFLCDSLRTLSIKEAESVVAWSNRQHGKDNTELKKLANTRGVSEGCIHTQVYMAINKLREYMKDHGA